MKVYKVPVPISIINLNGNQVAYSSNKGIYVQRYANILSYNLYPYHYQCAVKNSRVRIILIGDK